MRRAQVWAGVALSLLLCGCGTLPAQAAEFSPDEAYALENGLVSVKFDASGGDGQAPSTIYAQPGEGVTLPAAELKVDLGSETWRFVGWSTDVTASVP